MKIQEVIEFTPTEFKTIQDMADIAQSIVDNAMTTELEELGRQIYEALAQLNINYRIESTITLSLYEERSEKNAD